MRGLPIQPIEVAAAQLAEGGQATTTAAPAAATATPNAATTAEPEAAEPVRSKRMSTGGKAPRAQLAPTPVMRGGKVVEEDPAVVHEIETRKQKEAKAIADAAKQSSEEDQGGPAQAAEGANTTEADAKQATDEDATGAEEAEGFLDAQETEDEEWRESIREAFNSTMKEARELGAIEKEDEEAGTLPLRTPLIELLCSRLPEGVYNSDNIWDMGVDGSVATQESFLAWCDQNYIYEEDPKEQEGSDKNDSPTRSPKRALEEEEAIQKENRRDEHENNDNGKLTVHWQGHRRAGNRHRHQRHTRGRGCSWSSRGSHTAESTQEAKQSVRSAGTISEGRTKTRNSRTKRNRDS